MNMRISELLNIYHKLHVMSVVMVMYSPRKKVASLANPYANPPSLEPPPKRLPNSIYSKSAPS